ncbi:MAG: hypothetical protein ABWY93_09265 [Mycobacterium sp.]
MDLPGTPSDQVSAVLEHGTGDITTAFVSMAARHPDGADAEYLAWHTLDHRPEQYRLAAVRASLRLVSTPECREARAVCDDRYDPVDHVMTYFFSDVAGLDGFLTLGFALRAAGRMRQLVPPVERGVYGVQSRVAAERIKIGADVLPWWPVRGMYLLLESSAAPPADLIEVDGVAGIWSMSALDVGPTLTTARAGQTLTYCFLDADPVTVAERLRPVLEKRWRRTTVQPLLAAPFHLVVPYDWNRYLP